jgi:hypothetical protein
MCLIVQDVGILRVHFSYKKQESLRNGHVKIIGHQFGTKFKLVFCAKYDRGLDLGFWEILKPTSLNLVPN